jgi:hypothetical protein
VPILQPLAIYIGQLHSDKSYHFLIHLSHLPLPPPHLFQYWRLETRHQTFVVPTLNWGNGGRYAFQIVWNYSIYACPIVFGKDCRSNLNPLPDFPIFTQLSRSWLTRTPGYLEIILPPGLDRNVPVLFHACRYMNLPVLVHMILVITFSVILVRILGLYRFHKMWKDFCESVRGFWSNHSSTRICLLKSNTRDNEYIVGLGIYYQTKHICIRFRNNFTWCFVNTHNIRSGLSERTIANK